MIEAIVVMFGLLTVGSCGAAVEGLLQIPTADLTPVGALNLEVANEGAFGYKETDTFVNTQYGLSPRVAVGVDIDASEDSADVIANAKFLLATETARRPAVAFGIHDAGPGLHSGSYLVLTKELGGFRGHAGYVHADGQDEWFVGADTSPSERLTIEADYVHGAGNGASIGFAYYFARDVYVEAGALFPNNDGERTGFTVGIGVDDLFRGRNGR